MRLNPGVLDELRIPAHLKPGKYVLGFRCVATCTRCCYFPVATESVTPTDRAAQIRLRRLIAGQFVPTAQFQIVVATPPAPPPPSLELLLPPPLPPLLFFPRLLLISSLFVFLARSGATARTWSWLPKQEPAAEPAEWSAVASCSNECASTTMYFKIL